MAAALRAVRGATTLDEDTKDEVHLRIQELVSEMLKRNELDTDDLVSIIFSTTADITSAFPATGARELGLDDVPLLDLRQPDVVGSLGLCIRVLMHCYSDLSRKEIRHVFLNGARVLRPDLVE